MDVGNANQVYQVIESTVDEPLEGPYQHPPYSNGVNDDAEGPELIVLAASRVDRPVNRLSTDAVNELFEAAVAKGRLVKVWIQTGSSNYNREAWLSRYTNAGSSSSAQMTVPRDSMAYQELQQWVQDRYDEYYELAEEDRPDVRPAVPRPNAKPLLNIGHLVWRHENEFPGTHEKKYLIHGFELSHRAEAYDKVAWPKFDGDEYFVFTSGRNKGRAFYPRDTVVGGWRVEISDLEHYETNDSRKICAKYGLMWRRPDGTLITQSDYVGPTMCIHQAWGKPCYGPPPSEWEQPSQTEVVRRMPQRQKTTGASGRAVPAALVVLEGAE